MEHVARDDVDRGAAFWSEYILYVDESGLNTKRDANRDAIGWELLLS